MEAHQHGQKASNFGHNDESSLLSHGHIFLSLHYRRLDLLFLVRIVARVQPLNPGLLSLLKGFVFASGVKLPCPVQEEKPKKAWQLEAVVWRVNSRGGRVV